MIDITSLSAAGMGVLDTVAPRAANVLSIQIGALEYIPDFGIDLAYFMSEEFRFQNESFKAYLVERLASYGINVSSMPETFESLYTNLTVYVGDEENNTGLVAR